MPFSVSAGDLQIAAQQLGDLATVIQAKAASAPADHALAVDFLEDAAMIAGPPWSLLASTVAPLLVDALALVIENNTQGRTGSETPMHGSGARGSSGVGGGQIPEEQAGLEDGA